MKNIFFITFIALIIISGCQERQNRFIVQGNIKNAENKTLMLSEMTRKKLVGLDSAVLDKKGKFEFRGITETPNFYLLYIKDKQREGLTLILHPGDKITLKANASENIGKNYTVSGSEEMLALRQLDTKIFKAVEKVDSLGMIYNEKKETVNLDSLRRELDEAYHNIRRNTKDFLTRFIEENKEKMAGLRALYIQLNPREQLFDPVEDFKYYKMIDSCLYERYPNTNAVQSLHEQVKESEFVKKQQEAYFNKLKPGKEAPDIALPNPEGDTITLSSLKGKYVLLDFWASWCQPCRTENPHLVKAYKKYHDKGFEIYQVSLDKERKSWTNAIKNDNLKNWVHVSDLQYWNSNVVKLYNIQGIPANYLLDKEGKILDKNLRGEALDKKLAEIFQ